MSFTAYYIVFCYCIVYEYMVIYIYIFVCVYIGHSTLPFMISGAEYRCFSVVCRCHPFGNVKILDMYLYILHTWCYSSDTGGIHEKPWDGSLNPLTLTLMPSRPDDLAQIHSLPMKHNTSRAQETLWRFSSPQKGVLFYHEETLAESVMFNSGHFWSPESWISWVSIDHPILSIPPGK